MDKIKKHIKPIILIIIGSLIPAISYNLFIIPNKMLSGGVSGISLIINYMSGIQPGLLVFLINVPIFILGYRFIDKEFAGYSLIGMLSFSYFLDKFNFLQGTIVLDDIILCCIFGGVFNGIGAGILFRTKSSQGGTDIISAIVKKYYSMNIGTTLLAFNILIVSISVFIFKDVSIAMYTLIMMYISAGVTDKVAQGFDIRKAVMIITDKYDEVGEAIITELGRGVTYLDGKGAYSNRDREVIYCIVNLNQLAKIKQIVLDIDNRAFITISDVAEVKGKGFAQKGI